MPELPSEFDNLKNDKSLIDLESHNNGEFDLDRFKLKFVYDDIVLVELIDEVSDGKGTAVMRGGLYVPVASLTKAWRKAKVVLVGPTVKYTKIGDIVMYPNDKGMAVSNIEVEGYGKLVKGMFLNEQRLFGICLECK